MSWEDYILDFGQHLRELRDYRRMSQEALAAGARIDRTEVSLLERGKRSPRLRTIFKLAKALDLPPGALLPPMREPEPRVRIKKKP